MSNQRTQTQSRTAQQSPLRGPNKGPDQPPATVPNGGKTSDQEIVEKVIEYTPLGESEKIQLTFAIVRAHLCKPTKNGHMPTNSDILKLMMVSRQRALNPYADDCWLIGYDTNDGPVFNVVVAAQALFKRADVARCADGTPAFAGIESGVVVREGKDGEVVERPGDMIFDGDILLGGWAKVHRSDRKFPFYQRLKLETYDQRRSQWNKDKAGMIVKCTESSALRQAFPSDVGGLYLASEFDLHGEGKSAASDAEKKLSTGSQLADRLNKPKDAAPPQTRQDAPESTGQEDGQDSGGDDEGPFDDESGEDLSQTEDATGKGAPKQQEDIKFG